MPQLLFFITFILSIQLPAQTLFERQPYDHVWLFGQGGVNSAASSNISMNFNYTPPSITQAFTGVPFYITDASICDTDGNLKVYSNGIGIYDSNHQPLENGERINPGEETDDWVETGNYMLQGALLLPNFSNVGQYYLFYGEYFDADILVDGHSSLALEFKYALIDADLNNGEGSVLEKEVYLIQDTLDFGKITATRHGNGRDWWVVVPYISGEEYHRFLLAPNGVIDKGLIRIEDIGMKEGIGQAVFSTNGEKYINYSLHSASENYLAIYDFDRCTGLFTDPILIPNELPIFLSGVAVSENGRFLYESSQTKLFQIDLAAEDIANSRMLVGEYDGFFDGIDLFPTIFFLQQLAPDGRIIMNAGNTRYLHTIASPNKKGRDCNFLQHNINIPIWNVRTLPNFPYFGLGPWDGSPCDTLNINNPTPEAAFEYTVDSVGYSVDFFDGSHYAYEWEWDFGDGSSFSNEQYPLHTYTNPGAYEVCLTVSNVTGNDQYCEIIQLGPTATQAIFASGLDLEVYPNPFTTHFIVDLKRYNNQQIQLRVYNSNGYEVYSGNLPENGRLESKHWPSGLYFYELWEDSKRLLVGKLVKGE